MEQDYEKRGYLLEDFRLFHLREAQKSAIPYHYHDFCKLLLLRSGTGSYSVEGQRYHLIPGDVVLLGSRVIHRPEFEPGMPYDRTIIYISPAFLQAHSGADCALEDCFLGIGGHVLRPTEPLRQKLLAMVDHLEQELSGQDYGRTIMGNVVLLSLLVEIGRSLQGQQSELPKPIQPQNRHILDILHYLDAHLTEDISIDDLAEQFFLSKYHMMRLFRKETGDSIHGYLSDRRLFYAKELIAQGMSATEACFRSGWRSYSSFTRAYGKRFGTTPTGRVDTDSKLDATYE